MFIFHPQMTLITRIFKGLRPVTPSVVEGSHVAHIQHYVGCLDKLDMTDAVNLKIYNLRHPCHLRLKNLTTRNPINYHLILYIYL